MTQSQLRSPSRDLEAVKREVVCPSHIPTPAQVQVLEQEEGDWEGGRSPSSFPLVTLEKTCNPLKRGSITQHSGHVYQNASSITTLIFKIVLSAGWARGLLKSLGEL